MGWVGERETSVKEVLQCGTPVFPNNPASKARTETAKPLDMTGPLTSAWDVSILLENQCGPRTSGCAYGPRTTVQTQLEGRCGEVEESLSTD